MNIHQKIAALTAEGRDLAVCTVLRTSSGTPGKAGFKLILTSAGELHGTVGGGALEHRAIEEAREVLRTGENRVLELDLGELGMRCGGRATLVVERIQALEDFVLFGGGHVGRALLPILESLGFRVTVFDNRPEVVEALSGAPEREVLVGDYGDISPAARQLASGGHCLIATHGHEHDFAVLRQVLKLPGELRYIGLIGSRGKVRSTLERLRGEGLEAPAALYAPVGLDLGGNTAAEIAVAVAAEVIAVRSGRAAPHMRDRLREGGAAAPERAAPAPGAGARPDRPEG